jgi:tetratricopeptide (TPR) repeat protein
MKFQIPVLFAALLAGMSGDGYLSTAQSFAGSGCYDDPRPHLSMQTLVTRCVGELSERQVPAEGRAADYYGMGLLFHLAGRFDDAIGFYTKALAWMKNYGDVYEARGDAYEDLGQHEKALAEYEAASKMSLDDPWSLKARCRARAIRGRPLDRALADCNAALAERPDEWQILDTRALVYFRMGNYSAAIADCDAALEPRPSLESSLFIRGVAKLRLGDSAGGNTDIAAALRADYRVADIYALYGIRP